MKRLPRSREKTIYCNNYDSLKIVTSFVKSRASACKSFLYREKNEYK